MILTSRKLRLIKYIILCRGIAPEIKQETGTSSFKSYENILHDQRVLLHKPDEREVISVYYRCK